MQKKDIVIIGAGGFGREVAWLIEKINTEVPVWTLLGFIDDNADNLCKTIVGYHILGTRSTYLPPPRTNVLCSVGRSTVRTSIIHEFEAIGSNLSVYPTLIDPSAILADNTSIGVGSIICAGCIVSVNVTVGNHSHVNLGCTVGHDTVIKDFVTVYPGVHISGNVTINNGVEIGTGANILPGITIGENTVVGAGAVVVKDIGADITVVGNPAKILK
jgi:sugar O-acyltransferase (sialic acid O-acetyltransferase NeuD family)